MLSSESVGSFRESEKERKDYEEQQSDQCSPGTRGYGQVQDAGSFRSGCEPDQRLQRSPDLPRGRLRRRPDGQKELSHTTPNIP